LSSLANYFHTLRYLRPVQVFGRIRYKLRRPRPDSRPAPALRALRNPYVMPIGAPVSMLAPDVFRLLNLEGRISEPSDWQGSGRSQLWTYNLHYFDDLNAADAASRLAWHQRLLARWIDENPAGVGIGWDPYPVSRRIVNWIKWSLRGNLPTAEVRQSLAVQTRWLNRRLEFHLQGNHLFANAKALVHAGLFFQGEEAQQWLQRGLSLMRTEIGEQVLADGGHYERSTLYHAAFLEDLLDTVGIMHAYGSVPDPAWCETIARMVAWLDAMSHPDGGLAFFNDAAFGIAPTAMQLRAYAARLNIQLEPMVQDGLRELMPSGYVRLALAPFLVICDIAPVGPDHLPAHAHADTLSFELSCNGRRVFVNSGTSEYGLSAERRRQRGTAAHNTLVIDDEDSSEVWAGFRVARRSRARLISAAVDRSAINVLGEHDGYRRLSGRNLHRRRWTLSGEGLLVQDTVEGRFRSAQCYFYLHPEIRPQQRRGSDIRLSDSQGMLLEMRFAGAAAVDIVDSTWHPEFGVSVASRCIVVKLAGVRLETSIRACAEN
jgi:uncharacterized heparinase superfamily protein